MGGRHSRLYSGAPLDHRYGGQIGMTTKTQTDETEQRRVELVVKKSRVGRLATIRDPSAGSGLRAPTPAERTALGKHREILENLDEEVLAEGKVADIYLPKDGGHRVEWIDAAAGATDTGDK